jgi:hypothetical protein
MIKLLLALCVFDQALLLAASSPGAVEVFLQHRKVLVEKKITTPSLNERRRAIRDLCMELNGHYVLNQNVKLDQRFRLDLLLSVLPKLEPIGR